MSEPVKLWRKNLKIRMARLFGSKCCICGYNKSTEALEFHHLDPSKKDFTISRMRSNPQSWASIIEELKKCVMLCANCHREVHAGLATVEEKTYILEQYIDYKSFENPIKFCNCGKPLNTGKEFCSLECFHKTRQKLEWNSYELKEFILTEKDINKKSFVYLGSVLGVSDKTVAKYYKIWKSSTLTLGAK